jgi:hypothetical protein
MYSSDTEVCKVDDPSIQTNKYSICLSKKHTKQTTIGKRTEGLDHHSPQARMGVASVA